MYTSLDKIQTESDLIDHLELKKGDKLDFDQINLNIANKVPQYETLLNVTNLERPTSYESLFKFVSDIKNNIYLFNADYIGKYGEDESNKVCPIYDENRCIHDTVVEMAKKKEIKPELNEWSIDKDDIREESDLFKQCAYYVFVQKICDKIRLIPVIDAFKYSIERFENKEEQHLKQSKALKR